MPCWVDLAATDPQASAAFCSVVLGWTTTETGPDHRLTASVDGHAVAGISSSAVPAWTLHLATDDVEATVVAATAAGGTVLQPPGDVGTDGRLAVIADPTGARFGAWQAGQHVGAGLVNAPGALTWEDLRSSEPATAAAFCGEVFGWTFTPAFEDYGTVTAPGQPGPVGGVGPLWGLPASQWIVYFGVADTDVAVAVASAVRAGGTLVAAPQDTPFGRMAQLLDLDGLPFAVMTTDWSRQPDRS